MGGLTLATTGWAGAEVYLETYDTDGTWSFDARLGGDVSDVVTVLEDLAAWAASTLFVDPHTVTVEAVDDGKGRLSWRLRVAPDAAWTAVQCNATAGAKLGWPTIYSPVGSSVTLPLSADASVAPGCFADASALTWSRHDKSPGGVTGAGAAWANGATRYAARRPSLTLDLEPAAAAHLELSLRSTPQLSPWLNVYDPHAAAWRRLTYGAVTVEGTGDLHAVSFEALGGPSA